jgi:hypothetical protein
MVILPFLLFKINIVSHFDNLLTVPSPYYPLVLSSPFPASPSFLSIFSALLGGGWGKQ